MKMIRIILFLVAGALAAATPATDVTGTWKWTTRSPNGDIATTLKLESKDGKIVGAYSNQFGDTAISNVSVKDDAIAFEVVRDFGGSKYVVKYHGKLEGDTIKGTIEAPGRDGGEGLKLEWNATRDKKEDTPTAKPKR